MAPPRPGPGARRRVVAAFAALVAAVALALLTVAVKGGPAGGWERDVVRSATDVTDVVGVPARVVMQAGTFAAVVGVALAAAVITRRQLALVAIMAAGTASLAVSDWLKESVGRARPEGVRLREANDGFGYTSSHTAIAFGLAVVVAALLPRRWRWVPFAAAPVVGLARMHVGAHYPLDVVGGALAGTAVGLAVLAALGTDLGNGRRPGSDGEPAPGSERPGDDGPGHPGNEDRPGAGGDGGPGPESPESAGR